MGMDAATSGLSAISGLVGSGKAASAQNNATNEAAQQQQQVMQMINNYIGSVSPAVSQLVTGLLSGNNTQSATSMNAIGDLFSSSDAATQFGSSAPNTALENFNGLKPQELNALTTNAANSGLSDIRTAESQGAFGGNQNAVIQSELEKNREASEGAAVNIGSTASQQELGAQQSAASNALGGIQTGLSGLGQTAGQSTSLLGTGNQGIVGASQLLNPTNTGVGTIGNLATSNGATANSYGNPYAGASSGLSQFASNLGGGKAGKTPAPAQTGSLNGYYGQLDSSGGV